MDMENKNIKNVWQLKANMKGGVPFKLVIQKHASHFPVILVLRNILKRFHGLRVGLS